MIVIPRGDGRKTFESRPHVKYTDTGTQIPARLSARQKDYVDNKLDSDKVPTKYHFPGSQNRNK